MRKLGTTLTIFKQNYPLPSQKKSKPAFYGRFVADELHALPKSAILNISSSLTRFSAHVLNYLKTEQDTKFCSLGFSVCFKAK